MLNRTLLQSNLSRTSLGSGVYSLLSSTNRACAMRLANLLRKPPKASHSLNLVILYRFFIPSSFCVVLCCLMANSIAEATSSAGCCTFKTYSRIIAVKVLCNEPTSPLRQFSTSSSFSLRRSRNSVIILIMPSPSSQLLPFKASEGASFTNFSVFLIKPLGPTILSFKVLKPMRKSTFKSDPTSGITKDYFGFTLALNKNHFGGNLGSSNIIVGATWH